MNGHKYIIASFFLGFVHEGQYLSISFLETKSKSSLFPSVLWIITSTLFPCLGENIDNSVREVKLPNDIRGEYRDIHE